MKKYADEIEAKLEANAEDTAKAMADAIVPIIRENVAAMTAALEQLMGSDSPN